MFLAWAAHVKARGGREKIKKKKTEYKSESCNLPAVLHNLEAVVKLFVSTASRAARIVSKELWVILKVTINSFQGSKWFQSL